MYQQIDSTSTDPTNEDDSTSKHIFEYYRKYSQNRDLTKYFMGTPLSYLPEIKDDDVQDESIECVPDVIIQTDADIVLVTNSSAVKEEQSVSSTSSLNHKLEWDSLADIGYTNNHIIKRHNNTPIPVSSGMKDGIDTLQISNTPSYSPSVDLDNISDNVNLIIFPYSSGSDEFENPKNYSISQASSSFLEEKRTTVSSVCQIPEPCTSSSEEVATSTKISNFKNTLSYLKKKIGVPGAHSTPILVDKKTDVSGVSKTPAVKVIEKAVDHISTEGTSNENSDILGNKLFDIDDKESNSENISESKKQGSGGVNTVVKRVINLCQTKPIAVECISTAKLEDKMIQTENEDNHVAVQTLSELGKITHHVQQNSNNCIIYENHLEIVENNDKISLASSELLSNADSFEYKKYPKNNSGKSNSKTEDDGNNKNTEAKENECCQTSSGNNVLIAEAISPSGSDNPSEYIENYINLFQRLLKSKKYDSCTKKHYLKRIIKKISESRYLEESSTSSDLFFPKKSNLNLQTFLEAKVVPKVLPISTDSIDDKSLKNNISRHKSNDSKSKSSPKKRASQIKQLHHDMLANPVQAVEDFSSYSNASEVYVDNIKENIMTTENNQSYIKNQSLKQKSYVESRTNSIVKQYDSTSTTKSYNNWKDNKTESEKMLEEVNSPSCNCDYPIKVENKKKYQIDRQQSVEPMTKKNIEIQPRTTTTYTVLEKGNNDKQKKRNFIIETNLEAGTSKNKCFRLDGKNYVVQDLRNNDEIKKTRQVLADLEIISSDTTTNIKVTTFCEVCKLSPCICKSKSIEENGPQRINYTQDRPAKNVCHKCSSLCCSCSSSGSTSSQSICLFCCTSPCSCYHKMDCMETQAETNKKCLASEDNSCHCTGNNGNKEKSEISAHSSENCSKCRGSAPIHTQTTKSICTESHGTSTISSTETSVDGSLNKLFLNCKCDSETRCNCGFVDKLLRHFRKEDLANLKKFETGISQTDHSKNDPNRNSIGVQVNTQTFNDTIASKIQSHSRHVGIQTRIPSVKNKQLETTGTFTSLRESAISPKRTLEQNEQTVLVPQETMTEAQGKTEKNSMSQRNAVSQTLEKNVETNSSVDTEEPQGSDKPKTDDDTALMNRESVSHDVETIKNTDTSTSSSYICVSRYIKNSSRKGGAKMRDLDALHYEGANENARIRSSSVSTNERPHSNTIPPDPLTSITCICCKRITNVENISILQSANQEYPLCHHCLGKKPILTSVCYTGPAESVLQEKNVTCDSFRRIEEYCTCIKQSRIQNSFYCCHCQFKLKKTVKSRNAIAYTLTLENETPRKFRNHKKKTKQLEEIKVKVPYHSNRKTSKNEENFNKKVANRPPIHRSSENTNSEIEKKDVEKSAGHEKKTSKGNPTLQEYLMTNRPDFFNSAEYRRLTVVNHRTERQLNRDKIKLRFIENDSLKLGEMGGTNRLFTEREMREITSKNYKKLPEVQQKLIQSRERRLRDADKFIVDIFKKNVQDSVLKGKRTFPLNTNIVDMRA